MWYIGNFNEVTAYLEYVNDNEKYSLGTLAWASPIQSQIDPNKWAILKACPETCPRTYEAELQEVAELPNEFNLPLE